MRKGFVPIIVLIVVILIAVTAGGVYFLKIIPLRNNTPNTTLNRGTLDQSKIDKPSPQSAFKKAKTSDAQGKVAFVSKGEIWIVNSDGKELQQITNDEDKKFNISVSPDKKKIAYVFIPKDWDIKPKDFYSLIYNNSSGIAIIDLDSKETRVLMAYGELLNDYPAWSQDSQYISIWVGQGVGAKIINIASSTLVNEISVPIPKYEEDPVQNSVSPFVWISPTKVSYVEKESLILSDIDGSEKQVLSTGVEGLKYFLQNGKLAEKSPVPPFWSDSGRYVAFYKNNDDLHLMDVINKTDALIEKGLYNDYLGQYDRGADIVAFNSDETKLYMNPRAERITVVLDIKSGKIQKIDGFGGWATISPDKKKMLNEDLTPSILIENLSDGTNKVCDGEKHNPDFVSGLGLTSKWSADSKSVIGYRGLEGFGFGIHIFNVDDCSLSDIITGDKVVGESIWISN